MASVETIVVGKLHDTVLSLVAQVAELRGIVRVIGSGIDPETVDVSQRVMQLVDVDRTRMDRLEEMINNLQTDMRQEYALSPAVKGETENLNTETTETISEVNCTYEEALASGLEDVRQNMADVNKEVTRLKTAGDATGNGASPGHKGDR